MTIRFVHGDIFQANVSAIVNTVNCVGVMGAGVALGVRQRYPEVMPEYMAACRNGALQPGSLLATDTIDGPIVLNVATKRHWRDPSRIEWIETGLANLTAHLDADLRIASVALPPLGCGNGGLSWAAVRPLVIRHLDRITSVDIIVYEPQPARR
ncbi:macro domain-containing protein (plasmid) [Azospirillum sp. HJ39]|uniref:macro domain-containing protein n=1 Tax=Azospirillum sp. HJ39 TaxID=3159496 RepID=UPI003557BAD1